MISKKFISIYFSSTGLLILEMDSSKKKIKTAQRVEITEDLVKNNKVVDPKLLGQLIASVHKKLKIKQKSVGIVIPEFTALTKTIQIPPIEKEELNEAIEWEIQDYLPWDIGETIYDWKLIEENKEGFLILFVAVQKEVLEGYANAVSEAGLLPVVVETPSISLVRLSKSGDVGKLIFYLGKGQNLTILTNGEKFISSSVSTAGNEDELLDIGKKMISHFDSVKVESIELGGQSLTNEFAQKLSDTFGLKITLLGEKFSEIAKDFLQTYLVPISLQFKNPAKPSDFHTVNLLPAGWVERYETEKLKLQIWSLTLAISYFVWITFFATLGSYLYLIQQITSLKTADTLLRKNDPEKVTIITEIQNTNKLSKEVITVTKATTYPQTILNSIYAARPEGVAITHYQVDLDKGQIGLSGIAKDRNSLIIFKQKLEENKDFSLVDIPIASLEVEKNLGFSMTFSYLPVAANDKVKTTK